MPADAKGSPDAGPVRTAVRDLRGRVATVQRALALGVLTLIVWAFVREILAFRVLLPLLSGMDLGTGIGAQILQGVLEDVSLLLVLPALAWVLGLVFDGSPVGIGIGAALFVELFILFVQYLSGGAAPLVGQPAYLGTQLLMALAAGILAALALRHAQGFMDARERARRRLPPDPPAPVSPDGTGADGSGSGTSR